MKQQVIVTNAVFDKCDWITHRAPVNLCSIDNNET